MVRTVPSTAPRGGAHSVYGGAQGGRGVARGIQKPSIQKAAYQKPSVGSKKQADWLEANSQGMYHPVYGGPVASSLKPKAKVSAKLNKAKGGSKGKGATGAGSGLRRIKATHQQLTDMVHDILAEEVKGSVPSVAHLEDVWSPEEMARRVTRYLWKGGMVKELPRSEWQRAVRVFVEKAGWAYVRACEEKAWVHELDVGPALGAASVKISESCEGWTVPTHDEIVAFAGDVYKMVVQKSDVDKVLWEMLQETLPMDERNGNRWEDAGKPTQKLFNAISKSYDSATASVHAGKEPDEDGRVLQFAKKWVHDSVGRLQHTIENDESGSLAMESVCEFFVGLLAADIVPVIFEEDHPADWNEVVQPLVQGLFEEWAAGGSA